MCRRYGDLKATTTPQRVFTCFYIFFALVILSSLFSSVTEQIQSNFDEQSHERVKRAALGMQSVRVLEEGEQEQEEREQRLSVMEFLDVEDQSPRAEPHSSASSSLTQRLSSTIDTMSDRLGLTDAKERASKQADDKKIIDAMQKLNISMFDEDLKEMGRRMRYNFALLWAVILSGSLIMQAIEGWNFGDSFYWAVATISTVG